MSKDIKFQWYRGGSDNAHLQSPDRIPMQVDNMSPMEASYYSGVQPYLAYTGYVNTTHYDLEYQDLLIDTKNIDPKTGTNTRYRIIGDVETFPDHHCEIPLARMIGT